MSDPVKAVRVLLWGETVGAVAERLRQPGIYDFQYAADYLEHGANLSPLFPKSFPFDGKSHGFPTLSQDTFHGLPGLIADALPDKFGNTLIDAYMVAHGIPRERITVLQRLLYMGRRGMGALEFEPHIGADSEAVGVPLAMAELVENARRALAGKIEAIGPDIIRIGSSAGGARAKAVVGYNQETNDLVSGQFDLPNGFEHWLLKFDGVGTDVNPEPGSTNGYGRIEYAYSLMARAAQIQMSETCLLEEGGRAHFMTKRFDRSGNEKLHMQSLCGLYHLDFNTPYVHDYESLFRAMQSLGLGKDSIEEAFRRMVFNVMGKNCDDHTKNISFLMTKEGQWSLSPAYDISFAHNPNAGKWTQKHQMLVGGKAEHIVEADLLAIAQRFGLKKGKSVIEEVRGAVVRWGEFAERAGVAESMARNIQSFHELVPPPSMGLLAGVCSNDGGASFEEIPPELLDVISDYVERLSESAHSHPDGDRNFFTPYAAWFLKERNPDPCVAYEAKVMLAHLFAEEALARNTVLDDAWLAEHANTLSELRAYAEPARWALDAFSARATGTLAKPG